MKLTSSSRSKSKNEYYFLFIIYITYYYCHLANNVCLAFKSIDPLLWSVQNKMFKSSSTFNEIPIEHIIEVRIGEFLNLLCPKYSQNVKSDDSNNQEDEYQTNKLIEYHCIYMVSKQEYNECKINNIRAKKPILKCDKPHENLKYTLYISTYSPVPDAIEFIPGNNYYFISTSNGSLEGLNNNNGGTCKSNNMRIVIKVLDPKASNNSNKYLSSKQTNTNIINLPFIKSSGNKKVNDSLITKSSTIQILTSSATVANTQPAYLKPVVSNYNIYNKHQHPNSHQHQHLARTTIKTTTTTTASTTTSNSKTVNDIFILEPDSIDYSDLLNQLIYTSSTTNINNNKNNSEKVNKFKSSSSSDSSSSNSNNNERDDVEYFASSSSSSSASNFNFISSAISIKTVSSIYIYLVIMISSLFI